jgi:poly-gamma-glutamate synthesis protein (capsule biosynthesis protein)
LGIDVVSLANNHILDYGEEALLDTLDTLSNSPVVYGGAGRNIEEAKEVKYIEKENKKVAFICPSRVIPVSEWGATSDRPGLLTTYDPKMTIEQIELAENNADYTVVYVHWGLEHKEMPEEYQKTMAKQYIDAGADVVMGCHTHCLQGVEIYNGKPIVYSLGNFLFGGNIDRTMMVKVELGDEIKTQLKPCKAVSYNTELVTDADKVSSFYEYYQGISFGVEIDSDGYVN